MNIKNYRDIFWKSIQSIENISKYLQPKIPLLNELELTSRQENMMFLYMRHELINLSGMAERLGISKSAVSQAMNHLEKEDLLHRSINEFNRREVTFSLGKKGVMLKQQFEVFEEDILKRYISQLDIDELSQVRDTLLKLERIIKEGES